MILHAIHNKLLIHSASDKTTYLLTYYLKVKGYAITGNAFDIFAPMRQGEYTLEISDPSSPWRRAHDDGQTSSVSFSDSSFLV